MEECSNCLSSNAMLIDVIQGWRVVKMCENCAKQEGATIINPKSIEEANPPYTNRPMPTERVIIAKREINLDTLRRPLRPQNNVIRDLIPNFNWFITKTRREKNLTRKKLAEIAQCSENDLKLIENGILPADDFILVNKVQNALGINLRKNNTFGAPKILPPKTESKQEPKKVQDLLSGDEIEIIE